jgi:hypothetical protein
MNLRFFGVILYLLAIVPANAEQKHALIVSRNDGEALIFQTSINEPRQYDVFVTNTLDSPIEILKIIPSCGCMVIGNFEKKLEAKNKTKFVLSFTPVSKVGKSDKYSIIEYVDTNAPNDKKIQKVLMKFDVTSPVAVNPDALYWDKADNTDKPLNISWSTGENKHIKFLGATSSDGKVAISTGFGADSPIMVNARRLTEDLDDKSSVILHFMIPDSKKFFQQEISCVIRK